MIHACHLTLCELIMKMIEMNIEKTNRLNFRSCLEALSRPGTMYKLEPLFGSGLLAMASVWLYSEVSYNYEGSLDFEMVAALTGTKRSVASEADYLFSDVVDTKMLQEAKLGTADSPEKNAILLFQCADLQEGIQVNLQGPGIDGVFTCNLPVSLDFIDHFKQKNSEYPLGIDIFLIDDEMRVMGLPRTVNIEVIA